VEERTATLNRLRGLLAEFGHVLPLRAVRCIGGFRCCSGSCRRAWRAVLGICSNMPRDCKHSRVRTRDPNTRSNALARRAQARMGIGPITASALIATVGNGRDFKNGRQLAAWLGLVPRQYSTGGKTRLGHITKRGDPYLRTLLVMGARAVLQRSSVSLIRYLAVAIGPF
jgi:transposase